MLDWYDLSVYFHAGIEARHNPGALYSAPFQISSSFTYTPFAALLFAGLSYLPAAFVRWLWTLTSVAAAPIIVWVTLDALGWRGPRRLAATLSLSALLIWSWPVLRALRLGQIELLLTALLVADLCQSDDRRWKGAGVGVAAGIKLVPLIFIPYLVLCGKRRQGATALGAFGATVMLSSAALPDASVRWWLSGRFLQVGEVAGGQDVSNQSLRGLLARAIGNVAASTPLWLAAALLATAAGLGSAIVLHRSGRLVAGWLVCALTGLLVSPISWDHHWVWIIPGHAFVIDRAARARRGPRRAHVAAVVILTAAFAAWPARLGVHRAFVPQRLFATVFGHSPKAGQPAGGAVGMINANLYVVTGLVLLACAVAAATRHLWSTPVS